MIERKRGYYRRERAVKDSSFVVFEPDIRDARTIEFFTDVPLLVRNGCEIFWNLEDRQPQEKIDAVAKNQERVVVFLQVKALRNDPAMNIRQEKGPCPEIADFIEQLWFAKLGITQVECTALIDGTRITVVLGEKYSLYSNHNYARNQIHKAVLHYLKERRWLREEVRRVLNLQRKKKAENR